MTRTLKLRALALVVLAISLLAIAPACGVKGHPQPPLTPPELGHGQPNFKRTSEEFAFPNVPSPEATPEPKK